MQLSDELALVQTIDFFTPIVDDPFDFGQIAAANALSDLYAMGARPLLCLNIMALPEDLPAETRREILRGGAPNSCVTGNPLPPTVQSPLRARTWTDGCEWRAV